MFTSSRVKLLVITCAALFMAMLDNLVIGVALPSIQKSFQASISDLEWFMNAYTLAFSILLIPFSVLGERFGRKRMFLTGIVLFTVGSALSGISGSSIQLILSRALQGIGGAAVVPLSLTLVNSAFPADKRAVALGIWSGISGLGLSVGPLVGGLIVNGAPWQLIFWVNVPVGIIAFLLGMRWLPEARGERKPINVPSILLLGTGLFGIVFGLERGNNDGWGSALVLSCLIGGAALLAVFYLWERSRKYPLIRFELFRRSKYTGLVLAGFWMNAGIFCAIFLLTLFLQQAQGNTALGAGVREMVWTGCTMLAAPLAGLAVGKFGTRNVLLIGLLLQGGALLGFGLQILNLGVDFSFGYMVPFMIMAGTGMGLSFTPLSHGILSSVPDSAAGEASGVNNAMRELGGVFGIAIGGLVFQSGAAIQSPADFGDHIVPALFTGAAMTLLSIFSVIAFYSRSRQTSRQPQAVNELG
ncbi:EmrB/QacA subfamily drug resistance transporter [Paenibacillus taihuensis]|uniref:EmrB/QacA subfamily drug resistance transporter n=1 Tax=Paenibacillus taihuensis TaxID=1156355 RepID=A0A3D9QW06_9BACL|nr:MFS transporter [Paenibacillus taihuensis]REE67634.1 EmrB/QacA subfamily drug resistance transporter [Paenibacillus taihuensis]